MLKQHGSFNWPLIEGPAAFRRLCVETLIWLKKQSALPTQPPSGGCVLKRVLMQLASMDSQPPSGGCVLKL